MLLLDLRLYLLFVANENTDKYDGYMNWTKNECKQTKPVDLTGALHQVTHRSLKAGQTEDSPSYSQ